MLVPTLFSLCLRATLEAAFADDHYGVYIKARHNANLFHMALFKAKTKMLQKIVHEMLLMDDSALVPHCPGSS